MHDKENSRQSKSQKFIRSLSGVIKDKIFCFEKPLYK